MSDRGGIPVGSHLGFKGPPVEPERIGALDDALWMLAFEMMCKHPVEDVSQGYLTVATVISEMASDEVPELTKCLLSSACRQLGLKPDPSGRY
jgi:hypothetical protein